MVLTWPRAALWRASGITNYAGQWRLPATCAQRGVVYVREATSVHHGHLGIRFGSSESAKPPATFRKYPGFRETSKLRAMPDWEALVSTIARVRQLGIQPAISEPERGELRKCLRRIKQYSAWEDPGIAAMAMSCLAVLSVGRVRDAAAVDYDLHATLLRALARLGCEELTPLECQCLLDGLKVTLSAIRLARSTGRQRALGDELHGVAGTVAEACIRRYGGLLDGYKTPPRPTNKSAADLERMVLLARSLPIADMSAITARVQAFTHVLDKHGYGELGTDGVSHLLSAAGIGLQIGALDYGQFYGILAKGMARAWELVDVNEGRNTFLVAIAVLKAACKGLEYLGNGLLVSGDEIAREKATATEAVFGSPTSAILREAIVRLQTPAVLRVMRVMGADAAHLLDASLAPLRHVMKSPETLNSYGALVRDVASLMEHAVAKERAEPTKALHALCRNRAMANSIKWSDAACYAFDNMCAAAFDKSKVTSLRAGSISAALSDLDSSGRCSANEVNCLLRQALVMGGITPEMAIAGARLGVLDRDVENRIYDLVATHMQNKNLRAGQLFDMLLIVAMWERFDQRVVQSLVDRLGKLGFWDNLVSPNVHHTVRQVGLYLRHEAGNDWAREAGLRMLRKLPRTPKHLDRGDVHGRLYEVAVKLLGDEARVARNAVLPKTRYVVDLLIDGRLAIHVDDSPVYNRDKGAFEPSGVARLVERQVTKIEEGHAYMSTMAGYWLAWQPDGLSELLRDAFRVSRLDGFTSS